MNSSTHKQFLKDLYKEQKKIPSLIEVLADRHKGKHLKDKHLKEKHLIKNCYVKLQIVLSDNQEKNDIELEEILSHTSENNKKILMLGNAGVGKTTLMQYIANKWGNDNLWKDKFDYVYKISFKQLLSIHCKEKIVEGDQNQALRSFIAYNLTNLGLIDEVELGDRTLLLIDGYDEVRHMDKQVNGFYTKYGQILNSILSQPNVIMTSRPNAIDQSLKQLFGVTIENTGFDEQGIEDYLDKYEKENNNPLVRQNIENFLLHNPNIAEICKIPVNIAMLCNIWSGSNENSLSKITSMGDLYNEMVKTLGKRYIEKLKDHEKYDSKEKVEKAITGIFDCDELKILENLAHYNFTQGDSLVFEGAVSDEDTKSTSIQSAINRLMKRNHLEAKKSIIEVYKYGLLKKETSNTIPDVIKEQLTSDQQSKLDTDDQDIRDAQKQLFSFIHLTFQEYLTAYELKKLALKYINEKNKLPDEQVTEQANFLASIRSNPKYLMVLKFLSGLVSKEEGEQGYQLRELFWDSMLCNIDGEIELGVDQKVELLINLLGQVPKALRQEIPQHAKLVDFIDKIICQDVLLWKDALKSSNYISDKIEKSIVDSFSSPDDNIGNNALILVGDLISLINQKQYQRISEKLTKLLQDSNNNTEIAFLECIAKTAIFIDYRPAEIKTIVQQILPQITDQSRSSLISKVIKLLTKNIDTSDVSALLTEKLIVLVDQAVEGVAASEYASEAIGKLPLEKLDAAVVSQELTRGFTALVEKLKYPNDSEDHGIDGTFYASNETKAINNFPLEKLGAAILSQELTKLYTESLKQSRHSLSSKNLDEHDDDMFQKFNGLSLQELVEQLKSQDKSATKAVLKEISKLPLENLSNDEVSWLLPQLVDQVKERPFLSFGTPTKDASRAIGILPLSKLEANTVFEVLIELVGQLGGEADEAVSMAINKLPLGKLDDTIVFKELAKGLTELAKQLQRGGDVAKNAYEAIRELPLDKLDAATVSKLLPVLVEQLQKDESEAKYVLKTIISLPLDKLNTATVSELFTALLEEQLQKDESESEYVLKTIISLPLDKLNTDILSQKLDRALPTLVKQSQKENQDTISKSKIITNFNLLAQSYDTFTQEGLATLVDQLLHGGWDTINASRVIKNLLINNLNTDALSQELVRVLPVLVEQLQHGGFSAKTVLRVLKDLPLEKLDSDNLPKLLSTLVEQLLNGKYSTITALKVLKDLPLEKLDNLSKLLPVLVEQLLNGKSSAITALKVLKDLPLEKLDNLSKLLPALVGQLDQGGNVARYASEAISKLPRYKLDSDNLSKLLPALVKYLQYYENSDYVSKAISKLPLDRVEANTIYPELDKILKEVLEKNNRGILISGLGKPKNDLLLKKFGVDSVSELLIELKDGLQNGEDNAKYASESISNLLLEKFYNATAPELLIELVDQLGGVAASDASEVISNLPLDKLDDYVVYSLSIALVDQLRGDAARYVPKVISKLPLDKFNDYVMCGLYIASAVRLEQGGYEAGYASEVISTLPLNRIDNKYIVKKLLIASVNRLEQNVFDEYASEDINKLPLDRINVKYVSKVLAWVLEALVKQLPYQYGEPNRGFFASKAISKLPLERLEGIDNVVMSEKLTRGFLALIEQLQLQQDKDVVEEALDAISQLPLEKLGASERSAVLEKLVAQLDGNATSDASRAIGQLPLEKLGASERSAVLPQVLKKLVEQFEKGGWTAYCASRSVSQLPLDKIEAGAVSKLLTQGLEKLVAQLAGDDYVADYASRAISQLPLERLKTSEVSAVLEKLVAQFEQGRYHEGALEAIYKTAKKAPLKTINIFKQYLSHEQLKTDLLENLKQNIEQSKELNDNLEIISPLITLAESVEQSSKEVKSLLAAIAKKLVNVGANLNEELYKDLAERVKEFNKGVGKHFLRKVYEKILSDNKISENEQGLMIELINAGFTTSINDANEITFDGKTYNKSADKESEQYIDQITSTIINSGDQLADQYKKNAPLFTNSGKYLPKASSDIKEVRSVFSQKQKISNNSYVVTKLEEIMGKTDETFICIESRDLFGKHWIRKYKGVTEDAELIELDKHVNPTLLTIDGNAMGKESAQETLAEIFGEYKENNKIIYSVRSNIYESKLPDLKTINEEITKVEESTILFHQSLVGKGNYDNLEYNINQIEPHAFKVSQEISENKKLDDYYSALYAKLYSVMNAADAIASGKVALNTSDIKVTGVSFVLKAVPIVGKHMSSALKEGMGLIKSNEIKTHLINFVNLISLNPDSRKTILKIAAVKLTLAKKEEIKNLKDNEEVSNWKEKSFSVKCEDLVVVNIDKETFTSESAILGCIDALKIIFAATTNQTKPGNIKEVIDQLVKIPNKYTFISSDEIVLNADEDNLPSITVGVFDDSGDTEESQKNSSVLLEGNETNNIDSNEQLPSSELSQTNNEEHTPKCKCVVQAVHDIKYDNELLNNPELLKILADEYGMNKSVDIGSLLSLDLINEVIENNDHELLLAGALSMQQEYTE